MHFNSAHLGFDVKTFQLENNYVYVCKKLPDANEKYKNNYEVVIKGIKKFDSYRDTNHNDNNDLNKEENNAPLLKKTND